MVDILVVEDNIEVASLIKSVLKGFCRVSTAASVTEARECLNSSSYDLLVVDVNLPDGNGINLASQLKESKFEKSIPFLFLSGDCSNESQLAGLSLGAEDYITKPFNTHVLRAKILNCLKRNQRVESESLNLGNIIINTKELRAIVKCPNGQGGTPLDLTALEYRLLLVLVNHLNQALTRANIIDLVWSETTYITDRVVDQHIFCLRKKLNGSQLQIKSIYGYGYRLELDKS